MFIATFVGSTMSRLSIDLEPRDHQRITALAALAGVPVREYVLSRVLPDQAASDDERAALKELEQLLAPRIDAVRGQDFSTRSFRDIASAAKAKHTAAVRG